MTLALALCWPALHAQGVSAPAAGAPAVVAQAVSGARLAGSSRLSIFGFQIYDAKLWVQPSFRASHYTEEALALELTYLRDFEGKAIAERSLKEMRGVASFNDEQAKQWLAALLAAIPDVKKGDRILGLFSPKSGVAFFHNGKASGDLKDPDLARAFMGIWLSPKTSEPAMRQRLLGEEAARAHEPKPELKPEPAAAPKPEAKP